MMNKEVTIWSLPSMSINNNNNQSEDPVITDKSLQHRILYKISSNTLRSGFGVWNMQNFSMCK